MARRRKKAHQPRHAMDFQNFSLRHSISRILEVRDQENTYTCGQHVASLMVSYELKRTHEHLTDYEASIQDLVDHVWKFGGGVYYRKGPDGKYVECSREAMQQYESWCADILNYIRYCGVHLNSDYGFSGRVNRNRIQLSWDYKIRINRVRFLRRNPSPAKVRAILEAGHIIFGEIYMSDSFSNHSGPHVYSKDVGKKKEGKHYIGVVGIGYEKNRLYYEIKNSWGLGWGDQGYAKVLATFVRLLAYTEGAFLVENPNEGDGF